MDEDKCLSFRFMTEKVVGHGEDALPLLVQKEKAFAAGVFDGMGGAGAAICKSGFGDGYSKAYVASRIIRDEVCSYIDTHLGKDLITKEQLKSIIYDRLMNEVGKYATKEKAILRSKLVRDYPTTMALITLEKGSDNWLVNSFWAGDSHCYLWTCRGFFQLSKDDLEEGNDPMENLHNDSPISNCICADRDFYINHLSLQIDDMPAIIISATDGCFGYYPSPMHFENMLKESLQEAKDIDNWEALIEQRVQQVTGDDSSLALIAVGFSSFEDIKRFATKDVNAVKDILKAERNLKEAQQLVEMYAEVHKQSLSSGWEKYKREYMKYINDPNYA